LLLGPSDVTLHTAALSGIAAPGLGRVRPSGVPAARVPECGHLGDEERPDLVDQDVLQFLDG
jgi:pimeloyl-ACP methyl ester carboxylesterase